MPRLLVIHHSPSPALAALTDAVLSGADDPALADVGVVARPALETTADDVLAADGYVLITSANFGYMSGALKHFFDTTFLAIGGTLDDTGGAGGGQGTSDGRPYALVVHGRYDTTGAVRSVQSIVAALGWRQVTPVLEVLGDVDRGIREQAYEVGATVAATVLG